jgi:hypothetical protein
LTAPEKQEIIMLEESSRIGVKKTLLQLGINKNRLYKWHKAYLEKVTTGIITGTSIFFRQNRPGKTKLLPVMHCNLYAFGLVSFIMVFNFDKPLLILFCLLLYGLATLFINHYFSKKRDFSGNKFDAVMGILDLFPSIFYPGIPVKIPVSLQFFIQSRRHPINWTKCSSNFNAIAPFLFGGWLLLSFVLILFTLLKIQNTGKNILHYKISGFTGGFLNLFG